MKKFPDTQIQSSKRKVFFSGVAGIAFLTVFAVFQQTGAQQPRTLPRAPYPPRQQPLGRSLQAQSYVPVVAQRPEITEPVIPEPQAQTSYSPVVIKESFAEKKQRVSAEKQAVMLRHYQLLNDRYDLSNRPVQGITSPRGKPIQGGIRVRLPQGVSSWEQLSTLPPEEIRDKGLWPKGFLPLPHPKHAEGGMLFPKYHIDEINRQEARDLTRFDLDFDFPDHFMPEYPPAMYLTTRPDLGDVSRGQIVTIKNYYELFNGLLNPKQLEGLRLLVTPFPQQQFNATEDRMCDQASHGVTCFDCHVNGATNGATHLVGDIRPQEFRHRLDTPVLRGVNVQRLFGSQRALKTIEDFTEFEQRAAYFDGDQVIASKKGVNVLERGSQVHFMSEFESVLDFPPAPKLDVFGRLDLKKATKAEAQGEEIFNGKGRCAECHPAPYYTDNTMHDLQTERFFQPHLVNDHVMAGDGKIKTFPLRGIKDTAPYLHDGRCLTLEDTVEFHNLVLETKLTAGEKLQLLAFLYCL
ncbi:MAG: cytochrome B6 [Planctomycetaceae bacterium]|nr:cytochrome B6 [Planctomycetaceae bacterium]